MSISYVRWTIGCTGPQEISSFALPVPTESIYAPDSLERYYACLSLPQRIQNAAKYLDRDVARPV